MATNLGINHGDHQHDSITSVTDCILGLREKINDKELPGLTGLIDDWFAPDVDVNSEQFIRRFLHVFKQSDQDYTYEKIVGDYDDKLQEVFNDFVDGKIDANEAGQRYNRATVDKVPRRRGDVRKGGLGSVIPGEPNILSEPINLLLAAPTSIPSRIRAAFAKVFPKLKDPKRALYVPVSAKVTDEIPTLTRSDVQELGVHQSRPHCREYSSSNMCAEHCQRCLRHSQVCKEAEYGCSGSWLP